MEEMNELFYRDPYCREFDAEVLSCEKAKNGYTVQLSDTAFYPEGGGQPADHGMIGDSHVRDVHRRGGVILHETDGPLEPGRSVHCVIDWERRFRHMQKHTGEHIVSGLIHRRFGYENVGFHMGSEIQIDFNGPITVQEMQEIEWAANRIVCRNVPVNELFPDEKQLEVLPFRSKKELTGKVRLIEIPDADLCACCGTHVHMTGEIGLIKLLSMEKHKDGVRIYMNAGYEAMEEVFAVYEENRSVSVALSAKMRETSRAVERLKKENEEKNRAVYAVTMKYLDAVLSGVPDHESLVIHFEEGMDKIHLGKLAERLLEEKHAGIAAVLNRTADHRYTYLICSNTIDLRKYVKTLNSTLNGRGGGKPEYIQGAFEASESEICEQLKNLLKAS